MIFKRLTACVAVAALATSFASATIFTISNLGSTFVVDTTGPDNTTWTTPNVAFDMSFTSRYFVRLGTTGAFAPLSSLPLDVVSSGLSGTSVLNLIYHGSGFNVTLRYSLLGGATSSQISEQIRIINVSSSTPTFQLIQYNNQDMSNQAAGAGDTVTRTNSSSMSQVGSGAGAASIAAGATAIPTFTQLGDGFINSITNGAFTDLDTAAGAGVGQTSSPADAAFAFQWNTSIAIGATYNVGTDKIVTALVPEPASLCVLGLGAMALIRRRRRS